MENVDIPLEENGCSRSEQQFSDYTPERQWGSMNSIIEQRKTIFTHIVWMAHHKQMAHLYENDSRFEYECDPYFNSFHEVINALKTIQEEDRKPIIHEIFTEIDEKYPHMKEWNKFVKNDHFDADEERTNSTWPFWPAEFLYIVKLDIMLKDSAFADQYYKSDPVFYFSRCPCKICDQIWATEKRDRSNPGEVCVQSILFNKKKYFKSIKTNEIYDAFTHEFLGTFDVHTNILHIIPAAVHSNQQ